MCLEPEITIESNVITVLLGTKHISGNHGIAVGSRDLGRCEWERKVSAVPAELNALVEFGTIVQ